MSNIPDREFARSWPTPTEVQELLDALRARGVRDETVQLFRRLGEYPPPARLAVNVRNFLGITIIREVDDVLSQGLRTQERDALLDVQRAGLSTYLREIAHGLLNVYERWVVKRALAKSFRQAYACELGWYQDKKPLDDILSAEE